MMKKITLLCMLLAVSFGYAQTLPFDFEGTLHGFTTGDGASITNGTGSDVLQIEGAVHAWDHASITFATPIDLSDAANNTISFTIQSTTAAPGEVHQHGISFQGGGGALEANFQTTGTDVLNVELNFNANLGSREKMLIFTDVGNLGGIAATGGQGGTDTAGLSGTYIIDNISIGADPETCDDGILNNDETAIDCGGPNCDACDVTAPSSFTATAGTLGAFSVELLLTATDAGSDITYDVTYTTSSAQTAQTTGTSTTQTPLVIGGLAPSTSYDFIVTASDASGNSATPITVTASTIADTSNECTGMSTAAAEGSFSTGYTYDFVTLPNGTDVKFTIAILDTDKTGLNPEVFIAPSTFLGMTPTTASQTWEYTFTGETPGTDLNFQVRAAYAGGLVRTADLIYTVGEDCSPTASVDTNNLLNVSVSPSPARNDLKISALDIIKEVTIYNVLGKKVKRAAINKIEGVIDVSTLNTGIYILKYTVNNTVGTMKFIKE
jgi:hypothetical protein